MKILSWLYRRARASENAASLARREAQLVFPIWAAQGPFADGTGSAMAMRIAFLLMAPEREGEVADEIRKHAVAFDREPEKWEEIRQQAAQMISDEQRSTMREDLQILAVKRREEAAAFAKYTLEGIETGQLGPDEVDLLATLLSRRGLAVSGASEVLRTLRCIAADPDFLRPTFDTIEREWVHESASRYMVSGQ